MSENVYFRFICRAYFAIVTKKTYQLTSEKGNLETFYDLQVRLMPRLIFFSNLTAFSKN